MVVQIFEKNQLAIPKRILSWIIALYRLPGYRLLLKVERPRDFEMNKRRKELQDHVLL